MQSVRVRREHMGMSAMRLVKTMNHEFAKLGMNMPKEITLRSAEEGARFKMMLAGDAVHTWPFTKACRAPDPHYEWVEINGVRIRWPR